MSLLDQASLVLVPSAYRTGEVLVQKPLPTKFSDETGNYDGNDPQGSANLTFTRNSNATRVNSSGLVERVRTNLALQSQTFDNASWVKHFATITANATTAPDGTLTADKLIANSGYDPASATGNLTQTNVVTISTHTISLYAKAAEFTSIRFRENFAVGSFLTIDLTNGSITGGGSQYINPTATAVGDGWYRISFVTPVTADLGKYSIRVANTGDGTSGVFIWGLQFEATDFGPTQYIPTTSAAVSVGPTANVPRLDYSGGGCSRLILEPQRTNVVLFSESIANAAWVKGNSPTITTNIATAPDGYGGADGIQDTTGSTYKTINQNISLSANSTLTLSVFVKKETSETAYGGFTMYFQGGTAKLVYGIVDAVNGTVTYAASSLTATTKVEDYGTYWRISSTATDTGSNTLCSVGYYGTLSENGTTLNTVAGSVRTVWGFQAEIGASYATSYIPTLGASVTRLADAAYKTGISSLIGQTEGTVFADFVYDGLGTEQRLGISDGTSANYNNLRITTGGTLYVLGGASSVLQYEINCGSLSIGTRYKVALAYKQNDIVAYLNGSNVGSDNSATIGACSRFGFDNRDATSVPFRSPVNQALLFKTRLSNADLANLTAL